MNHIVITIDGPAGAGKSTIAKQLAKRLNIAFLDTGAMYRALTLKAMRHKISLENEDELVKLAVKTSIKFKEDEAHGLRVLLDGEDVSEAIRSLEITNNTFYIARAGRVREIMVKLQQEIGKNLSIVGEGRDLGTVVFPRATYKFYLDADFEERCKRRIRELRQQGKEFDEETLKVDLYDRDQKDFTRAVGPLKKAPDAIAIDGTGLTVEQTVDAMLKYINTPSRI